MENIDIIEKILYTRNVIDSSLISWILKSKENLHTYITYKNFFALIQDGYEMNKSEINNDFELSKRIINRK